MATKTTDTTDILAKLQQPYSGPTKELKGRGGKMYTYIPWQETARALDEVFGPDGWSEDVASTNFDTQRGVYSVTTKLSVRIGDTWVTRTGTGVGVVGNDYINDTGAHDTPIKTAASDALSRAAKKLGARFGLFLYDKGDNTGSEDEAPRRTSRTPASAGNAGDAKPGGPTAKQRVWLKEAGYSPEELDAMTFEEAKDNLSAYFDRKNKAEKAQAAF